MIRQPIITIAGHVDHGKTSLLDSIRGTKIADKESGFITQKISFTSFPAENIKKSCCLLDKYNISLKIPGFLFIDTPGHQAFTNLRKRGGSLADIAILVIDINEGIMPQTAEVLQILRQNKTPFIIALNKIDRISGYRKQSEDIKKDISLQSMSFQNQFNEKFYTLQASLNSHGFKTDLFWNVSDFTQKICMVPCSAKTKQGLSEIIMVLCGLSQKFLTERLSLGEKAKGVIFEITKVKAQNYIQAILYDGKLKKGDEIAIASFDNPITTKIRVLEEVCPLCDKFAPKDKVTAATGIRMQLTEAKEILPGMPFQILKGNIEQIEKEFKKEISENIQTDKEGIIIKADSLGSLEALLILLKQNNVKVLKAGIGNISKTDIISAKTNKEINELYSVILGFNVEVDEDALEISNQVKIFKEDVVYKLIENLQKWQEETRREIEKIRLLELSSIFKLQILSQHIFRNSKPAIFGVKVVSGKLKTNVNLINESGEETSRIKNIQSENKSVEEAYQNQEVAVSLPNITFDRQLKNTKYLYSEITEKQFKSFKNNKDLLTQEEIRTLQEIAEIKRKTNPMWGI